MPRTLIVANAPVEGIAEKFRQDGRVDITKNFEDVPRMIIQAINEGESYSTVIYHWFSKRLLDIHENPKPTS